jgi:hypothetical protein
VETSCLTSNPVVVPIASWSTRSHLPTLNDDAPHQFDTPSPYVLLIDSCTSFHILSTFLQALCSLQQRLLVRKSAPSADFLVHDHHPTSLQTTIDHLLSLHLYQVQSCRVCSRFMAGPLTPSSGLQRSKDAALCTSVLSCLLARSYVSIRVILKFSTPWTCEFLKRFGTRYDSGSRYPSNLSRFQLVLVPCSDY